MNKMLAIAALSAGVFLVGCADHSEDMRTTGPNVTPDYAGSHYNPGVNSSGAAVGRSDPAINASVPDVTGTPTPSTPAAAKGMSGTSDQNAGSSSPSGATGSSGSTGH